MTLWKWSLRFGVLALAGGAAAAQAQSPASAGRVTLQPMVRPVSFDAKTDAPAAPLPAGPGAAAPPAAPAPTMPPIIGTPPAGTTPTPAAGSPGTPETRNELPAADQQAEPGPAPLGPTPLLDVKILQDLLTGDDPKPWLHVAGWADFDYTYRSTGSGINNVAPVMNRFGDELLTRQLGLYLFKPLDEKELSWGFNAIFIAGADASFLSPTAGGWANTDPRFGTQFTDLNLTLHLPILTDGGVDIKAGRQTTCLGPMGALPWQRPLDSSDYAWYNMEEGRFTGVSSIWHVSKQLDWYNGFEMGWGSFFDPASVGLDYLTQISYWLDCEAKKTKVWTTFLTGPTNEFTGHPTTVLELGLQHNYNEQLYQIVDTQMVWSKAPVFGPAPGPGYRENAYDVYTYVGYHLDCHWDVTTRVEWYYDQDGLGYAGGFGNGLATNYYEGTIGLDYHPTKWIQFRPEIRYDHASNPNFGVNNDKKDQLSIAAEVLFKF